MAAVYTQSGPKCQERKKIEILEYCVSLKLLSFLSAVLKMRESMILLYHWQPSEFWHENWLNHVWREMLNVWYACTVRRKGIFGGHFPGVNILPFSRMIIREKFLKSWLLGKSFRETDTCRRCVVMVLQYFWHKNCKTLPKIAVILYLKWQKIGYGIHFLLFTIQW